MGTAKWNNCRKPLQVCLHQGIIVWEIFVLLSDSPSAKECYVLTAPKQDFGIASEIPYGSYKWAHRSPWELWRTVGTPEFTGEMMRDSKMNECAKKRKKEPAQSAHGQGCEEGRVAEERWFSTVSQGGLLCSRGSILQINSLTENYHQQAS